MHIACTNTDDDDKNFETRRTKKYYILSENKKKLNLIRLKENRIVLCTVLTQK